jgi:hypothetical protein
MSAITNERKAELLGFLRDHAQMHHLARANAAVKAFYNDVIDQAERSLCPPPVQFQWTAPKVFHVDGVEVRAKGRGLSLAWMRLAATQTGVGMPHLGHVYTGKAEPHRCARQALVRAADDVERVSLRLAAAIRSIGTANNNLVLGKPPNVMCSSPFLVDLASRAEALGIDA